MNFQLILCIHIQKLSYTFLQVTHDAQRLKHACVWKTAVGILCPITFTAWDVCSASSSKDSIPWVAACTWTIAVADQTITMFALILLWCGWLMGGARQQGKIRGSRVGTLWYGWWGTNILSCFSKSISVFWKTFKVHFSLVYSLTGYILGEKLLVHIWDHSEMCTLLFLRLL